MVASRKAWRSMSKFKSYCANLAVIRHASEQDLDNEFIQSGIIYKFAMQFELSWRLLYKTLQHEGKMSVATCSPRGVIKSAYTAYDFIDEKVWLSMLNDRNASEHVYDSALAERLVTAILDRYIPEFMHLLSCLIDLYGEELLENL